MNKKYLRSLIWVVRLKLSISKAAFFWDILYSIYQGLVGIINVFLVANLINSVTRVTFDTSGAGEVYFWLVAIMLMSVIESLLANINRLITRRVDQLLELEASNRYFTKLYELNQQQFEDEKFMTTASRARQGLGSIWSVTHGLTDLLSSFISVVAALVAVFLASPLVGFLLLAVFIPISAIRIKQNKLTENVYKEMDGIDRVGWRTRWYLLDPQHMSEIRLLNGFKQLVSIWRKNVSKVNDMAFSVERNNVKLETIVNTLSPLVTFLSNVYFFRMLLAGTIGLDRFIFLRGVLEQADSASMRLASSLDRLHEVSISMSNFEEFYYTEPIIHNGSVKVSAPLTIEFKNVSFSYPSSKKPSLDNVSFLIMPGSKLALVGENGAGKTTLIKLLLRQYLPTSGQILVNGHDIADIDQLSYYKSLSILTQDFLILSHLTIKENLTLGLDEKISEKNIYECLELAGAAQFVKELPNGLNQRLDSSYDDGSGLSGGQMQRLGVARSLLRSVDIMILDEPTSAIDAKAEYTIFNNIYGSHANKTTLIVSHRFSTVRKADTVIVMERGKIIEFGSHAELIKYAGLYKEMFDTQAEGYK